ncbi:MAG: aldo/keto reductase [Gammaproteobacteria bacterium]|nr:aldo/keto reductase [Gammaproteobacteria bacterium]
MKNNWLWLGAWSLGGEGFGRTDARESRAVLDLALHEGIRHFDTAGFYAHGKSELLLAKALGKCRDQVFISTKGGLLWEGRKVRHCADREALRTALFSSLERLGTDYVDLYQLHWPDPAVPLTESIRALTALQEEGLIRSWGVGNLSADQVRRFIPHGARIPHQVHFNPLHRADEVLAAGSERCYHCVVSPLEQGLLANASKGLAALGKRDVRRRNPYFHSDAVRRWLDTFHRYADLCPIPQVSLVYLWLLAQPGVNAVISGAKTRTQLREVLAHRKWIRRLDLPFPRDSENFNKDKWNAILEETAGQTLWQHMNRSPVQPENLY